MTTTLVLMRHAKSDWFSPARYDHDRPLASRGHNDAPKMGRWLLAQDILPELVLSSTAKRARQTAILACKSLGYKKSKIRYMKEMYACSPETLLETIRQQHSLSSLMLVGHNPEFDELYEYLCSNLPEPEDGKLLPTATIAVLKSKDNFADYRNHSCRMIHYGRPREIDWEKVDMQVKARGNRKRPQHCYQQSGVIVYRIVNGEAKILLLSSRKGNRWVIPKGVCEEDMTAEASAAKEAYEEGGVRGRIDSKLLGTFQYEKWNGICTVQMYKMQVDEILDKWPESYRRRRWLSVEESIPLLAEQGLKEILGKFSASNLV